MKTPNPLSTAVLALLALCLLLGRAEPARAADTMSQTVASATEDAKRSLEQMGRSAEDAINSLWSQIDSQRLKNRTRDEIVAWLLMGMIVGGLLSGLAGLSRPRAFLLGLVGAFLGGLIVHLTHFDIGLGPVLIRYEDLLFSLVGGMVILLGARWFLRKKPAKKPE